MRTSQLISIGLFTAAVVLTIYAWMDRARYSNRYFKPVEAFDNPTNPLATDIPTNLVTVNQPANPTDADAIAAHKTLLKYTNQNVANGLRFMKSIGKDFFVQPVTLRTDIDPSSLVNNYVSPLQTV